MKTFFKRALSVVVVLAVLISCFGMSLTAYAANISSATIKDNLCWANDATAIADSIKQNSNAASKAIDGKFDNSWQTKDIDARTADDGDAWVGVEWASEKTFDKIEVFTHIGSMSAQHFSIQIKNDLNEWVNISALVNDYTVVSDQLVKGSNDTPTWISSEKSGIADYNFTSAVQNNRFTITFTPQTSTAVRFIVNDYYTKRYNNATFRHDLNVRELCVFEYSAGPAVSNIALTATPIVSSREDDKNRLNNNSVSGAWMAQHADPWVYYAGYTWDEYYSFSSLEIYWRDLGSLNYEIQVMNANGVWTTVPTSDYTKTSEAKVNINTSKFGDAGESKSCYVSYISITGTVQGFGIRTFLNAGVQTNYQMYEFEVYGLEAEYIPAHGETELTNNRPNLALTANGGTAFVSRNAGTNNANAIKINDGKSNGNWGSNAVAYGTEVYAGVLWTDSKSFSELVIYWRDAHKYSAAIDENYIIEISSNTTNGSDGDWTPVSKTVDRLLGTREDIAGDHFAEYEDRINYARDIISLSETVSAKAVRIRTLVPQEGTKETGQLQIYEFEVYVPAIAAFNDIAVFEQAVDENYVNRLLLTNISEDAVEGGKIVRIDYTVTRGGVSKSGVKYATVAWKNAQIGSNTVTAADISGNSEEYVMGILFNGILATDDVSVGFMFVDASEAE